VSEHKDWMVSLPKQKPQLAKRRLISPAVAPMPIGLGMTSEARRHEMVRQCQAMGVKHPSVLNAMQAVPRHLFVDNALASRAYDDCALPIGHEQTISKPSSVARMIELVLQRRDQIAPQQLKALEIGTGCGYQAAVMSQVFNLVYSIERIKALATLARERLRPFLLNNLRLSVGDGHLGLPREGPFDAIVLAAAGAKVPEALLEQLAIGGLLVAPVGDDDQALHLIERFGTTDWRLTVLDAARFVPLKAGVV
jgi:protein-L-isoaspartate(D-aspartate) O-methyltransferase